MDGTKIDVDSVNGRCSVIDRSFFLHFLHSLKSPALAKKNNGAPGIDGVTFAAIEESGVEPFLVQIRDELLARPLGCRMRRYVEMDHMPPIMT